MNALPPTVSSSSERPILFVCIAEWSRLRHTGLSELSRLPSVVKAANKSGQQGVLWSNAYLIVPGYKTHMRPKFNDADTQSRLLVRTPLSPKIVKGTEADRIVDGRRQFAVGISASSCR